MRAAAAHSAGHPRVSKARKCDKTLGRLRSPKMNGSVGHSSRFQTSDRVWFDVPLSGDFNKGGAVMLSEKVGLMRVEEDVQVWSTDQEKIANGQ
jgi:hypothetical protein